VVFMRILVAEDDAVTRRLLQAALQSWGHEVQAVNDGVGAWVELQREPLPDLVILDWQMPGLEGVDICRRVRAAPGLRHLHVLLLTGRSAREDIILALEAGADDYVTKPFDPGELRARVKVAGRMADLQKILADGIRELEAATTRLRQLQGLMPICSYCKRIRTDKNYWLGVENYLAECTEAKVSHGICPECYESIVKPELEAHYGKLPDDGEPPATASGS
jgi:DNA-binding response OmpR family regulator